MKILIKGKVDTVSIDELNPHTSSAHLIKVMTWSVRQQKKKTTNSKTAGIVRGTSKEPKGSSSKITPRPVRQGSE